MPAIHYLQKVKKKKKLSWRFKSFPLTDKFLLFFE